MKFTTIITNYNYADFLPQAIESAINQIDVDNEIIIVDDGSSDGSGDIANWYENQHENVRFICKENGGQASAFNAGYEHSTGDIIAFLDADDFWYPQKLNSIEIYHKHYGIVQHNLLVNGIFLFSHITEGNFLKNILFKCGYCSPIPTSGLSLSRWVADLIFPIPEEKIKICADLYLKHTAIIHSDIWSLKNPLGYYRSHNRNNWYKKRNKHDLKKKIMDLVNVHAVSHGYKKIPYNEESVLAVMVSSVHLPPGQPYVIFGAGEAGKYFSVNQIFSKNQCLGFIDSDPTKWGEFIGGIRVYSPESLKDFVERGAKIVIASMYCGEILHDLQLMGFQEGEQVIVPRF